MRTTLRNANGLQEVRTHPLSGTCSIKRWVSRREVHEKDSPDEYTMHRKITYLSSVLVTLANKRIVCRCLAWLCTLCSLPAQDHCSNLLFEDPFSLI